MPIVKDKITGKVISRQPYNQKGIDNAAVIADSKPEWEIVNEGQDTYASGGKIPESNAIERSDIYQLGGIVDPINPMNLKQPMSPEGDIMGGEDIGHDRDDKEFEKWNVIAKKGGKIKKKK